MTADADRDRLLRLRRARDAMAATLEERHRLATIAAPAGMSPFHFQREFVRAFGETPLEFLTRRRMEEARRLLARTDTPVTEVCLAVGYDSLGTFSARFHERTGYSPSAYRRTVRRVFVVPRLAPYAYVPACFLAFYGVPPLPLNIAS